MRGVTAWCCPSYLDCSQARGEGIPEAFRKPSPSEVGLQLKVGPGLLTLCGDLGEGVGASGCSPGLAEEGSGIQLLAP